MAWKLLGASRKWTDVTSWINQPITGGTVHMRRDGTDRWIVFTGLVFAESGSGTIIAGLAQSDRPELVFRDQAQGVSSNVRVTPVGNVMIYNWTAGTPIHGQLRWSVEEVSL